MSILVKKILGRAGQQAFRTALWCWILTAAHGIWLLGHRHGYLDGGFIPLYPSQPVTYASFFVDSVSALVCAFLLTFSLCIVLPLKLHLASICIGWLVGGLVGLGGIAFVYRIDFGTTFTPIEATKVIMVDPMITSIWFALGIVGAAVLTAPIRKP